MTGRPRIDWDAIEPVFRAGRLTLREIAQQFGCSDVAVLKHARQAGWVRNLPEKIKAEANRQVALRMVSERAATEALVNSQELAAARKQGQIDVLEARTVEVEAKLQADAIIAHRGDVRGLRSTVASLAAELAHHNGAGAELLQRLHELVQDADDNPQRRAEREAAWRRVVGLAGRSKVARDLVESTRQLVNLERKVLNMDDGSDEDDDFEAAMRRIAAKRAERAGQRGED